jgi:hypothetical protein
MLGFRTIFVDSVGGHCVIVSKHRTLTPKA